MSASISALVVARTRRRSVLPRRVFADLGECLAVSFSFVVMSSPGGDYPAPAAAPGVNDHQFEAVHRANCDPAHCCPTEIEVKAAWFARRMVQWNCEKPLSHNEEPSLGLS